MLSTPRHGWSPPSRSAPSDCWPRRGRRAARSPTGWPCGLRNPTTFGSVTWCVADRLLLLVNLDFCKLWTFPSSS